jgi:hypothetical protein
LVVVVTPSEASKIMALGENTHQQKGRGKKKKRVWMLTKTVPKAGRQWNPDSDGKGKRENNNKWRGEPSDLRRGALYVDKSAEMEERAFHFSLEANIQSRLQKQTVRRFGEFTPFEGRRRKSTVRLLQTLLSIFLFTFFLFHAGFFEFLRLPVSQAIVSCTQQRVLGNTVFLS